MSGLPRRTGGAASTLEPLAGNPGHAQAHLPRAVCGAGEVTRPGTFGRGGPPLRRHGSLAHHTVGLAGAVGFWAGHSVGKPVGADCTAVVRWSVERPKHVVP